MLNDIPQWFDEKDEPSYEEDELSDIETYYNPFPGPPAENPGREPPSPNTTIGIVTVDTSSTYSPPPQPYNPPSSVRNLYINDYPPLIPAPPLEPPSIARRRSYDWICDGCRKKVYLTPLPQFQSLIGLINTQLFYSELQYRCRECEDFDFCPYCYDNVWHQHPKSSFTAKQELSTSYYFERGV
jgi:hypothetical protein